MSGSRIAVLVAVMLLATACYNYTALRRSQPAPSTYPSPR